MKGIDHVQIAMPEGGEGKADAFFGGLLGLARLEKPSELRGRGGCWFAAADLQIHLGIDPDFSPQKKAHVALIAPDIDSLAGTLASQGFPVRWQSEPPDRDRLFTEDPFGNRLELMRDGHGFSQR